MIQRGRLLSVKLFPSRPHEHANELKELIVQKIDHAEPFSIVRLGDGEGRILAYPEYLHEDTMKSEVLLYQFGKQVKPALRRKFGRSWVKESIAILSEHMNIAISSADVIGAPSHLHHSKPLSTSNLNARLANSVAIEFANKSAIEHPNKQIFDVFIFRAFQKQGLFFDVLNNLDFLGVISHTDNSSILMKTFQIKQCKHIKIPGHQTFMKSKKLHFPTEYKTVIDQISVPYKGAVFLVAAGYLGKLYCHEIKLRGGIALDIGSVFDSWTGLGRLDAIKDESMRL
ncbi:hypothetical protein [Vibrio hannami]